MKRGKRWEEELTCGIADVVEDVVISTEVRELEGADRIITLAGATTEQADHHGRFSVDSNVLDASVAGSEVASALDILVGHEHDRADLIGNTSRLSIT